MRKKFLRKKIFGEKNFAKKILGKKKYFWEKNFGKKNIFGKKKENFLRKKFLEKKNFWEKKFVGKLLGKKIFGKKKTLKAAILLLKNMKFKALDRENRDTHAHRYILAYRHLR